MIRHCKNCGMPDTRPGIYFNEDGICQGCIYEKQKDEIDWNKRWEELKKFIRLRGYPRNKYDCVIAVSGGKDSYFQTHIFKEKLGLKCLLVCVDDGFTHTKAGIHNLKNLVKEFDCDLFVYKMKGKTQKKIMQYTFEKFNKPLWVVDQMIYTVPIWFALQFSIQTVVYGENVSVTRGLKDNRDTPDAWNQINNSVVSDIKLWDVAKECELDINELHMVTPIPNNTLKTLVTPIYTSYYVRWDAYENYQFALSRGFKTLEGEWNRWGGFMNYWQIDSYGYMMAYISKYMKLGHSGFTDCVCELIRAGHISREKGWEKIEEYEGEVNNLAMVDFCKILDYTAREVYEINQKFYRRENHEN